MPTFNQENDFSKAVLEFLKGKLEKYDKTLRVNEKMQVISGFTIGKERHGEWKVIAGSLQQDIVIYRDRIPFKKFQTEILKMTRKAGTVSDIVPTDGEDNDRDVVIPLVVVELKIGKSLVTHGFITYSSIAQQIKNVFPHLNYFFALDSNETRNVTPETVLRYTKGFDRVFLEWGKEKEILWQDVESHLEYLKRLKIL